MSTENGRNVAGADETAAIARAAKVGIGIEAL